jgi:hypothetical protein
VDFSAFDAGFAPKIPRKLLEFQERMSAETKATYQKRMKAL